MKVTELMEVLKTLSPNAEVKFGEADIRFTLAGLYDSGYPEQTEEWTFFLDRIK